MLTQNCLFNCRENGGVGDMIWCEHFQVQVWNCFARKNSPRSIRLLRQQNAVKRGLENTRSGCPSLRVEAQNAPKRDHLAASLRTENCAIALARFYGSSKLL